MRKTMKEMPTYINGLSGNVCLQNVNALTNRQSKQNSNSDSNQTEVIKRAVPSPATLAKPQYLLPYKDNTETDVAANKIKNSTGMCFKRNLKRKV